VSSAVLDPRLHACRADVADIRLRDRVAAANYAEGQSARVVVGRAPVHRSPEKGAALDTHYHYGERVLVFEQTRGHAWCQSLEDGYVGYVSPRHLALGEPPAPTHFIANLGAYTYRVPDLRADPLDFLPRHAAVVVAARGLRTRGTEYARLDSGGFLPMPCLSPEPPRSADLVAAAALYLGCPYLWGGRSFLGLDCSGLVQQAFRDLGIAVPRDTDMQAAAIGDAVAASGENELRRGDLLYLPGHVMVFAGDGSVLHADGATMSVRRDRLAALMRDRGLDWAQVAVRRHPAASSRQPDRAIQ
jgi:cell wall-associated NlpC family hydrolase